MPIKPTFHAFTTKHGGLTNRIIVEVGFLPAFEPHNQPKELNPVMTNALWDTGATASVLTHSVVEELNLTPTGTALVQHAGGATQRNSYMVNVFLPNLVAVGGILVTDCENQNGFGAIIGMDIITMGDFALTHTNGQTFLSFRIPSIARIDYVEEANKINFSNAHPHKPCPCGALNSIGTPKKFKDCHGKKK